MPRAGILSVDKAILPPEVPLTFTTDLGVATPASYNLNILGGTGCSTTGASDTITIDIDADVATSYVTDSGTATPASNILNVLGGDNINTSGSTDTLTINLDSSLTSLTSISTASLTITTGTPNAVPLFSTGGAISEFSLMTDGQLIIGNTGNPPTLGQLASADGSISYSFGAGTIDLSVDATQVVQFLPDSGTSPIVPDGSNQITIAGGTGCASVGGLNTLTINLDTDVPLLFHTDGSDATPASNAITIAGGTNITTTGASSTVTVTLDDAISLATSVTSPLYTTSAADMNITAAAGQDIIITMGDAAAANGILFKDSASATVATLDSDGKLRIGDATDPTNNTLGVIGSVGIGTSTYAGGAAPSNGLIVEGDFGVGTITPSTQAEVSSTSSNALTVRSSVASGYSALRAWGSYDSATPATNSDATLQLGLKTLTGDPNSPDRCWYIGIDASAGPNAFRAPLTIGFDDSVGGWLYPGDNDFVTITWDGNFGIGVVPTNLLDVAGGVAIGSSYAGSSTAPTDGLIVESQVGIGTDFSISNSSLLHALSSAVGTGSYSGSDLITLERNSTCNINIISGTGSAGSLVFSDTTRGRGVVSYNHSGDSMSLVTAGSTAMTILSTGDTGIGTASPASILNVYQNTTDTGTAAGITVEQDGTGDAVVQYLLTGGTRWVTGIDNSDSDKFNFSPSADVGSSPVMTIQTTGEVGIGTASPDCLLHVSSGDSSAAAVASSQLCIENSTSTIISMLSGTTGLCNIFFGDSTKANDGLIQYDNNGGSLSMTANSIKSFTIETDGAVTLEPSDVALTLNIVTTANLPTPSEGMILYNTSLDEVSAYSRSAWRPLEQRFVVGSFTGPTSTGNHSVTGTGFQPQLVEITLLHPDNTTRAISGHGYMDAAGHQFAAYSDTSETSTSTSHVIYWIDFASTTIQVADFYSMDSNGFTINFTTVDPGMSSFNYGYVAWR